MKLNFIKVNPTENMTVLILDTLPRASYASVAKKIMGYNHIFAEQVGFIEQPETPQAGGYARLQMMGGEFCGNATRALAATLAYRGHLMTTENASQVLSLEVSGAAAMVNCRVEKTAEEHIFRVAIEMPLASCLVKQKLTVAGKNYPITTVYFAGICHVIVNARHVGTSTADKIAFFDVVKGELKASIEDAIGLMFYDEQQQFIEPLVYVKSTDSLIWERGCGSGTTAVAVMLAHQQEQSVMIDLNQPGGVLSVAATWENNKVSAIELDGVVEVVAEGVLQV